MRPAALLLAAAAAGCVGPASHPPTEGRWLDPGTGRASVSLSDTASAPLRIAVYGDSRGNREAHRAVVAALREARPDLVIFTGDALDCYPTGHMPDLGAWGYLVPLWPQWLRGYPPFSLASLIPFPQALHETVLCLYHPVRDAEGWNGFLEDTAPLRLGDRVPFLFAPGNHDLYHRFDRGEVARIFGDPGDAEGRDPDALWHAVDAGGIRVVVLDTGADLLGDRDPVAAGGPQVRWLEAVLADAEARGIPVIAAFHCPPFSSGAEDPPSPEVREVLAGGVLARHRVALVLNGHSHAYERIERPLPGGGVRTYVVTGGAGAPFHHEAAPPDREPGSRVFVEATLHFVLLEAGPDGIRGRAVAVPSGKVLDTFEAR